MHAYLQDSKRFLNWYPLTEDKPVLPDQPEFLNNIQLANQSPVSIVMHCLIKFSDGSTATMPNVTVTNVAYMQVVYFPTGYKQLGIDTFVAANYPGKTVTDYYIYLSSGAFQVSLMQNYHIDTGYYENVRYLYIRNAFGLLDIVRCTGRAEQTNSLKFEMVRTDGRVLPDKLNWRFEKTDTVKVNTGFITAGAMLWLSDMDFTEAYELIGSNLHPIVFKDLDLPIVHDQVYQYSAELQYEYAYNEISE